MSSLMRTSFFFASALAFTACDDGGSGGGTKPVEDPATTMAGQTTGQQSNALTMVEPSGGAQGAQAQFGPVGSALQGFVGAHQQFKAQQMAQSGLAAESFGLEVLRQAQAAEEFSFEDGHLIAKVTYAQQNTSINYDVDLQIDAIEGGGHSMDGHFRLDFLSSQGMYEIDYKLDAGYNGLLFDAAGCPIDGSIDVDYDIEVGGDFLDNLPPEARQQAAAGVAASGRVKVTFGPACGDNVVEGN